MKILGRFAYTADVVPKGSRKPRRQALFGEMEYDILEVAPDAMVRGALDIAPSSRSGGAPDGSRCVYDGWDGRLWRPLMPDLHDGNPPERVDRAHLAQMLRTTFPLTESRRMPIDEAFDVEYGPGELVMGERQYGFMREDAYEGKIISSDRAESVRRHLAASRRVVAVGDVVYAQAYEPCWRCSEGSDRILLREFEYADRTTSHVFRLDRLDEMRKWLAKSRGELPHFGQIHAMNPDFLRRDDLAHYVNGRLQFLIDDRLAALVPYLPDRMVLCWAELRRVAVRHCFVDRAFEGDLSATIADLKEMRDALAAARVPTSLVSQRDDVVRRNFGKFFARVDFEMRHRHLSVLDPVDAAAVADLRV